MARLAGWLALALVLCGLAFIAVTAGELPAVVATHFGAGGRANGWMPRNGYLVFALVLQTLLPLSVYGGVAWLPRRFEGLLNLPHRDYWLAPARREATLAWLRGFGAWLAAAMALFAIGIHAAILAANARTPARLDEPAFIGGLVAFVAAIIGGVIAMSVRFRNRSAAH
jgi:uncharacterized membrane protein